MKHKNVIWEGRFQPIHRGHVAYVRELMKHAERVWVFVVDNERSADADPPVTSPVPEFTTLVDTHHGPEKNPLPFWLRYLLVQETLRDELGPQATVTVWGGRRLDFAWPFYRRALPENRVFLTPTRDAFEDAKAAAWKKLGEQVVRLEVGNLPKISATMLRDRLRNGKQVDDLLCPRTRELLEHHGYLKKLAGALNSEQS